MAVYYDMGAHFESEVDANAFRDYWDGVEIELSNGEHVPFHARAEFAQERWCVGVFLKGMSISSPTGDNDKLLQLPYRDEVVDFIFTRLKTSPTFTYAMFGGECAESIMYDDFHDELLQEPDWPYEGLVMRTTFWDELGKPDGFEAFVEGFVWRGVPRLFS